VCPPFYQNIQPPSFVKLVLIFSDIVLIRSLFAGICFLAFSAANPLPVSKRQQQLVNGHDPRIVFRGTNWDEAQSTCSQEEFDLLVESTRITDEMVNAFHRTQNYWQGEAWNRYFVRNSDLKGLGNWQYGSWNRNTFAAIKNTIHQASMFPKQGRRNKKGERSCEKQVAYTCRTPKDIPPEKDTCQTAPTKYRGWTGPTARTYDASISPNGWVIQFCPRFFKDGRLRYLNDITKTSKSEKSIGSLRSFEYIIAHEWMHAKIFGYNIMIVDMIGSIPGQPNHQLIYGDSRSHEYAWK
jgi:hypothetical protein